MFQGLNSYQHDAVHAEGDCLASACPGSGKTRVLALRATWLIKTKGAMVVAVTFTKDSALELEGRVKQNLDTARERTSFMAGTFHRLALRQLTEAGVMNLKQILSPGDWVLMVRQSISIAMHEGAVFGPNAYDEASSAIQAFQASLTPPPPAVPENPYALVFEHFSRLKRQAKKYDFSDILLRAIRGMADGTLPPLAATYLLVDEAQDMDEVQYAWITAHTQPGNAVRNCRATFVGDDDQSIYGWRWATGYAGMMRFMTEHAASHFVLPVNYRCVPEVLEPAARLIRFNLTRVEKPIRSHRPQGGSVRVIPVSDRMVEAEEICNAALMLRSKETMAVISRNNMGLNAVETLLAMKGVNYKRVGGDSFLNDPAVSALVNVLESLSGKTTKGIISNLRLTLSWFGVPGVVLDRATVGGGTSVDSVLSFMLDNDKDRLTEKSIEMITSLRALYPQWVRFNSEARIPLVLSSVVTWLKFETKARDTVMIDLSGRIFSSLTGGLSQRLTKIRMFGRVKPKAAEVEDERSQVTLITMHSSKGLEFDNVWIISADDGVMPHKDSPVEEERRLFYVAMTRARNHLVISHDSGKKPSPFLAEAGLAYC